MNRIPKTVALPAGLRTKDDPDAYYIAEPVRLQPAAKAATKLSALDLMYEYYSAA